MMPIFSGGKSHIARAVIPTRILVVDEEALIRWSICSALAAEGFEPVAAADGATGRRLAAEWPPPRVVILDQLSSEPDCLELLTDIRSMYPGCRFVVMTTARDYRLHAVFGAGVELIQKPFDLAHVVALVSDLATRGNIVEAVAGPSA
jgi:DNA-binding response OmpR family regulator